MTLVKRQLYGPVTIPNLDGMDSIDDTIRDLVPGHDWTNEEIERVKTYVKGRARDEGSDGVRLILAMLLDSNSDLTKWAIAYALRMDYAEGISITACAKMLGVTKAALDKTIQKIHDLLDIPRSPYLKSQESRQVFAKAQRDNHWRNRTAADLDLCKIPLAS